MSSSFLLFLPLPAADSAGEKEKCSAGWDKRLSHEFANSQGAILHSVMPVGLIVLV